MYEFNDDKLAGCLFTLATKLSDIKDTHPHNVRLESDEGAFMVVERFTINGSSRIRVLARVEASGDPKGYSAAALPGTIDNFGEETTPTAYNAIKAFSECFDINF